MLIDLQLVQSPKKLSLRTKIHKLPLIYRGKEQEVENHAGHLKGIVRTMKKTKELTKLISKDRICFIVRNALISSKVRDFL